MANIAEELKKLVARMTGVSVPSSIKAETIADVFAFAAKNINRNSDGLLIITDLAEDEVNEEENDGNLLSEPIKSAEPWVDNEVNYGFWEMSSLGLEVGKTYRLTGYYGGESLDSSVGATTFSEDVVAVSAEDEMGVVGGVMLIYSKELVADGGYSFGIEIYDKIRLEGDMTVAPTPVYDESVTNFAWGNGGSDEYRPLVKNAVLESIVEVEASEVEVVNLMKEELTYTSATHGTHNKDYSIGLEAGKTYKLEGVYGENSLPFEMTATAVDYYELVKASFEAEGITDEEALAALEEAKGVVGIEFKVTQDIAPELTTDYVVLEIVDNAQINENCTDLYKYVSNTCEIHMNTSGTDGAGAPVTYKSITEVA